MGVRRVPNASVGVNQRSDSGARPGATPAARPHGPFGAFAGKRVRRFSANTWRLADLGAKHAFLRAGLGWGGMPVDATKRDLANRSVVKIRIEDVPEGQRLM